MTTTTDHDQTSSPSMRLQATMAAARVSFTWLGTRKSLNAEQQARAAQPFGAEGQYIAASKKLLDTAHPAFKAVTSIRNRIAGFWKGTTLGYPEPGVRLIRRDRIEGFNGQMIRLREDLHEATEALDRRYAELQSAARERLGDLYDRGDYPSTVRGLFDVAWDFPSVEPPGYLLQLRPDLYEQERQRIARRFEDAVTMAEQAFAGEFGKLVDHLTERITGVRDGKPKVFRDSAVNGLREFFDRFRSLSVGSNDQLEQLVSTAQDALRGVAPQQLRDSDLLRRRIAEQLGDVQSHLEDLLVDRPRRRVLRPGRQEAVA